MGERTGITWCDRTFNPWIGCAKVSPACTNCYADRDWGESSRHKRVVWGANGTRSLTSEGNWSQPLKWNREATPIDGPFDSAPGPSNPLKAGMEGKFYWNVCGPLGESITGIVENTYSGLMVSGGCYGQFAVSLFRRFEPPRPRVFCASLADVFEEWQGSIQDSKGRDLSECVNCGKLVAGYECLKTLRQQGLEKACDCSGQPDLLPLSMQSVRQRLFKLIDATPYLDWLLLTKRPENIQRMWTMDYDCRADQPIWYRSNVWLGASVENQEYAEKRIPALLKCRDLSPVLWLSCEPLVGHVELREWLAIEPDRDGSWRPRSKFAESPLIDWVVTGGESGPNARPTHPEWFRSLRDQCKAAGVPFHFKQNGEFVPGDHDAVTFADEHSTILPWHDKAKSDITPMARIGAKRAGRLLDGVLHDAFPQVTGR